MRRVLLFICVLAFSVYAVSQETIKLDVAGVNRKAVLFIPSTITNSTPIVFCFHGHGGSIEKIIDKMDFPKLWSTAIIVYPQGLRTKVISYDDLGLQTGWQIYRGHYNDRDVLFFDCLIDYLKKHFSNDCSNTFVTGFSNGAIFSYVLLAERRDSITAIAPIAGFLEPASDRERIEGKPIFHVVGTKDTTVKYERQRTTIDSIISINKCNLENDSENSKLKKFVSVDGYSLYVYEDNIAHVVPEESIPMIIDFFKSHIK